MSTITGLHHVLLTVSDLHRSTRFYRDILGLKVYKKVPDNGVAGAKVIFTMPDGTFFNAEFAVGPQAAPRLLASRGQCPQWFGAELWGPPTLIVGGPDVPPVYRNGS